jgi:hypothetical protein
MFRIYSDSSCSFSSALLYQVFDSCEPLRSGSKYTSFPYKNRLDVEVVVSRLIRCMCKLPIIKKVEFLTISICTEEGWLISCQLSFSFLVILSSKGHIHKIWPGAPYCLLKWWQWNWKGPSGVSHTSILCPGVKFCAIKYMPEFAQASWHFLSTGRSFLCHITSILCPGVHFCAIKYMLEFAQAFPYSRQKTSQLHSGVFTFFYGRKIW